MKILHVFRAPVGGLFRHVIDLATMQAQYGHDVGLIADSMTGGERAAEQFARLSPLLSLGVHRFAMPRNPHPQDLMVQQKIGKIVGRCKVDVVHGHGSKGGLYARLPGIVQDSGPLRVYTPHGGSLNYHTGTRLHGFYMQVEKLLERGTDLLLFESQFVADRYFEYVCKPDRPYQVFFNGLLPREFEMIQHRPGAADFMFIGELRAVKGVHFLIDALARLQNDFDRPCSLEVFGSGPDEPGLKAKVNKLGLENFIRFRGPVPARHAFESANVMLMGSTFESMPYVVLEAAGCAQPVISTNVGGIPEIFGTDSYALIESGNVMAMHHAMRDAMAYPQKIMARAARLRSRVMSEFSAERMAVTIERAYTRAIDAKQRKIGAYA